MSMEQQRQDKYQLYVANTMYYDKLGQRLEKKLSEILDPEPEEPELTPEEVIDRLKKGGIEII